MRILAISVAALAVLGGCGDDGPRTGAVHIRTVPTNPGSPVPASGTAPPKSLGKPGASAGVGEGKAGEAVPGPAPDRPTTPGPPRTDRDDPTSRGPSSGGSLSTLRRAVSSALTRLGYRGARIELLDGGRAVRVRVRRADACRAGSVSATRVSGGIRDEAPKVRTVALTVAASGQSLSAYRRSRCGGSSAPDADGPVVYSRRGTGPFTTPGFRVAARRWTVSYRNEGDFFQVFVIDGARPQPFVLSRLRPGSGRQTFRGPGRFRLKISGGDGWSITVREGS